MRSKLLTAATLLAVVLLLALVVLRLSAGSGTPYRAYAIEQRLRCPVCKSVSIADSPSETATAMRQIVQQQVSARRSDTQIVDYFRARYGDWILLDPPATGATLTLWVLAAAAAATGAGVLVTVARRRPPNPPDELSDEQRARVAEAVQQMRITDDRGQAW